MIKMEITESLEDAFRFASQGEALNAGEDFCHAHDEHARSNVDAAKAEFGWVSVITREHDDYDHFLTTPN